MAHDLSWLQDRSSLEPAERLYLAYNRGGPPERAGLAWNGQPVPTWAELLERSEGGDAGAAGVVDKWRSVADFVDQHHRPRRR